MSNTRKFESPIRVGRRLSAPADTEAGVIYFDTTDDVLRFRDSSSYKTVLGAVSDDTAPALGGNLDVGSNSIQSSSSDVLLAPLNKVRRAKFSTQSDFVEEEYIHSIALAASQTDEIISELTFNQATFEAVLIDYKLKDSAGAVRAGTMKVATNGSSIAFFDGPVVQTAAIAISFDASIQLVGQAFAEFTGQVAGMTTDVTITADFIGLIGNSVSLVFDGIDDIDTVIAAWNLANPANTVTLTAGNGAQVPDNLEQIDLAGGDDGATLATITYTSSTETAVMRVDVKRIKA